MGKYRGYEKYKYSGVEWLGKIPEHWQAIRLKHITNRIIDGAHFTPTYVSEGIPFLRVTDIVQAKNNSLSLDNIKFIPEEEHNTLSLRCKPERGDLLYSKNGTIGVPRVVDWDFDFSIFVSLCLIKVIKQKVNVEFLQYSLLGKLTETQINIGAKSNTVTNLHLDKIKEFWVTLPPLDEQEAIARFLDYKTKQIDDLIAKKETLIEKLDEKRTALISHAVTKGLDPNVPMKDSGIEWIGEIPENWKRGKLNYFCKIISGGTPDRNNPDFWEGDIPWVKTGEVNYQDIYSTEEYISAEGLNSSSTTLVKPETLLMAMYGQGNTRGRVAILKIEAAFNQACLAICPLNNLNVYFLYYFLISAYKYIRDTGNESSQMNLSAGIIGKINILVTNLEEQQKIVQYLDKKISEIDQQKAKIQKAIELLKEYRTALITNAVTGKIDVRQIPIP
ncbi:type I restriction enzyme specificity protein [Chlorogloeopsis fritschii PCC 6912]|uniref:Type I restriction enzyme specificity protein n=2 Tax=Chlorogloeopsis fritschii TaxID=1124 RepID=A0A433MX74_CHLFR|nr:type I restriction enzyme specificity protein [Chlorogloeopsis fritschii PCC 6912]